MNLSDAVEINTHGWLWPKGDQYTWRTVAHELGEVPDIVERLANHRVCIQAGGNGGLWPNALAEHFERVYTFEPDPILFRCLVHNVDHENVVWTNAAVGAERGFIGIDRWMGEVNPGANRVKAGGHVPMVVIDDYGFENVDLIQLDIEGYELNALKGAADTLARCRPAVVIELRNHSHHFGTTDDAIREWLGEQGYHKAARLNSDELWLA